MIFLMKALRTFMVVIYLSLYLKHKPHESVKHAPEGRPKLPPPHLGK